MASEVTRREILGHYRDRCRRRCRRRRRGRCIGASRRNRTSESAEDPRDLLPPAQGQDHGHRVSSVCLDAAKAVGPRIEVELIELAGRKIPGEVAAGIPLEPGNPTISPSGSETLRPRGRRNHHSEHRSTSATCRRCPRRFSIVALSFTTTTSPPEQQGRRRHSRWRREERRSGIDRSSVQVSLMSQQLIVVGDGRPTGHWGGTVWSGTNAVKTSQGPDITRDEPGMATVKNLGRRWRN